MIRILLWDIDGTLIRSAKLGGYKEYTIPVLEEIFGTAGRLADMQVSGMTDLQIVFEALRDSGFSQDEILARAEVLVSRLTEEARRVTGNGAQFFELLPGVRETLEALAAHSRYESALVTGNIRPMALPAIAPPSGPQTKRQQSRRCGPLPNNKCFITTATNAARLETLKRCARKTTWTRALTARRRLSTATSTT